MELGNLFSVPCLLLRWHVDGVTRVRPQMSTCTGRSTSTTRMSWWVSLRVLMRLSSQVSESWWHSFTSKSFQIFSSPHHSRSSHAPTQTNSSQTNLEPRNFFVLISLSFYLVFAKILFHQCHFCWVDKLLNVLVDVCVFDMIGQQYGVSLEIQTFDFNTLLVQIRARPIRDFWGRCWYQ